MPVWIQFQVVLFLVLTGMSFVTPKKVFEGIIILAIIFTTIAVFTKFLLIIQFLNIGLCYKIGMSIINGRNKIFDVYEEEIKINKYQMFMRNHPIVLAISNVAILMIVSIIVTAIGIFLNNIV
ncbi:MULTISPECIES: hypothetical protein [Clostridium]|nr:MULTISPECIES: hypothetical protein [unclassified Clostridium]NFG63002.1 hypothetical protein [Clostridium botulinum]NFQ09318.1 hypothetical protein [Clostridium botulinum]